MWKVILMPLVPMLKDMVFDALVRVLKDLAKQTDNPIDDQMIAYLEESKPAIMVAVGKVL